MTPQLSIVIVSYHSQAHLARCLPSIARQGVEGIEIIVVDNAPGDGTATWLARQHADVHVIANPTNTGYAGGNNVGIHNASGEHVLILNPDTELHDGALLKLLEAVTAHPDALVTPKLLNADGTVNACGNQMHYTGITTCRGLGEPAEAYSGTHAVPLVSGAAFIARRTLLLELGGFDTSFFMYHEDTDLSLRARSLGYHVLCAADAEISHHYVLHMSPGKFFYLERNRLLTLLKNLAPGTLRRLVLPIMLTEMATWAFALSRGPAYLAARARGYLWLWHERPVWRAERARARAHRRVTDTGLLAAAATELPFDQLAHPTVARFLSATTDPVYRWLRPRTLQA